ETLGPPEAQTLRCRWRGVVHRWARTVGGRVPRGGQDRRVDRALAEVRRVAHEQHGCVTVGQCLARGLSRKRVAGLVRAGHWTRMHRGVYLTSSSIPTWRERASAALLYAGRGAALSHRAAGYLHGCLAEPPRVIEVSIPEERRVEPSRGMRVVRRRPVPEAHGHLRTINRADTVVDLVAAARTTDDA